MMQRLTGACMVIAAFVYSGIYIIKTKRENVHALRELCSALRHLHAELSARLSPLPEVTARLAKLNGKYAPVFFSEINRGLIHLGEISFNDIWGKAADKTLDCIGTQEREALKGLGSILGKYELEEQLNAIKLCCTALEKELGSVEKELAEKERTCIGICSVLGVLVAVVLI